MIPTCYKIFLFNFSQVLLTRLRLILKFRNDFFFSEIKDASACFLYLFFYIFVSPFSNGPLKTKKRLRDQWKLAVEQYGVIVSK
jgi:hypothetical protein